MSLCKVDLHIHTTFSDGKNTLVEYAGEAIKIGYKTIAFTDHICDYTNYLEKYISEIKELKKQFQGKLTILAGIESKVINPSGELDLPDNFHVFRDNLEWILAAFHRIPKGHKDYFSSEEIVNNKKDALKQWNSAMLNTLQNPLVSGIAHPTAILQKYSIPLTQDQKKTIAQTALSNNKQLEFNMKYRVPDDEFVDILKCFGTKLFLGSDSHSIKEFQAYSSHIKEIADEYN